MTLDGLKAAAPGLVWRVDGNRYIGTPKGIEPRDAPIAVHVRRDGRVARVGGFMFPNNPDVSLYEGLPGDVVSLIESEAVFADDESKRWESTADDLRRALKGGTQ